MFSTILSLVLAVLVNLISAIIYDWFKNRHQMMNVTPDFFGCGAFLCKKKLPPDKMSEGKTGRADQTLERDQLVAHTIILEKYFLFVNAKV